jgi:hypothetical protein
MVCVSILAPTARAILAVAIIRCFDVIATPALASVAATFWTQSYDMIVLIICVEFSAAFCAFNIQAINEFPVL